MIIVCIDKIIVTSKLRVTRFRVPHSEVELQTQFKPFTAAHWGSNINQYVDWIVGGAFVKSSRSFYAPHLVQSVLLHLFKHIWGDNAHWISKNNITAAVVPWEPRGKNKWQISRICEFRVMMEIMTGLLGYNSSSTLRSRADEYVKTLATLGVWLHHSPCSLGCRTNNTLADRSLSLTKKSFFLITSFTTVPPQDRYLQPTLNTNVFLNVMYHQIKGAKLASAFLFIGTAGPTWASNKFMLRNHCFSLSSVSFKFWIFQIFTGIFWLLIHPCSGTDIMHFNNIAQNSSISW